MVKIDFWLVQHKENAVFQNPVMGSHGLTSQVYAVLEGKKNIYIYIPQSQKPWDEAVLNLRKHCFSASQMEVLATF